MYISGETTSTLRLFLDYRVSYPLTYPIKIGITSIYKNNSLVLNLLSALDPNGRPCMYDTVSGQPFYNAGTGEFLYPTE